MHKEKGYSNEELLEALAQKSGCAYLSDLKQKYWRDRAAVVLAGNELPCDYPIEQWKEAAIYLLDHPAQDDSSLRLIRNDIIHELTRD